jgi:hypothetical protein
LIRLRVTFTPERTATMTLTRSGLLIMALAVITSPACKNRSIERQAIAPPEQALPTAVETHTTAAERSSQQKETERTPLATGPLLLTSPTIGNAETAIVSEMHEASPSSHVSALVPETMPRDRRSVSSEAEMRQVIDQVQARMEGELARAQGIIVELQRVNAELRQTLAAERQLLADLRQRLMSGRSIALQ